MVHRIYVMLQCSISLVTHEIVTMRRATMANNRTKAGDKIVGAEAIETAMKNGSEAFKTGFEKAVKGYDNFFGYSRETVEAYVKAANAAGKGVETLHNELYSYSKQSVEDSISATRALFASKSVHEALE